VPGAVDPLEPRQEPSTAGWRRGVGVLIGLLVAVPVIVYAIWLFARVVG